MGLSLWIPARFQFGEVAAGEARRGATRQAVAEAIKRQLFRSQNVYTSRLQAYLRSLSTFDIGTSNSDLARVWTAFFSTGPDILVPSSQAGAESDVDRLPAPYEASFCLALHALCAECALHWMEAASAPLGDDEPAADDEPEPAPRADNSVPGAVAEAGGLRWAVYGHVLTAITMLLRQTAELRRWKSEQTADSATNDTESAPRVLAAVMLDALLEALADSFETKTAAPENRDGKAYTPKYILLTSPTMASALERLVASLPFRFTVQPLRQRVAYRFKDDAPSAGNDEDHFRVELIGYRRGNAFLRGVHSGITETPRRPAAFAGYVKAVNLQQAVPWRINRELLHWARLLRCLAAGEDGGAPVAELDPSQVEAVGAWARKNLYEPVASGERKAYERSAEFLDSPLAQRALDELCETDEAGNPRTFYLPWKADYRGRIYAETPWLTPQGGDLQRALFEFERGRRLHEAGVRALRRHGGNLVARDRLLADLGIGERQVVTLSEREQWVVTHEAQILASARSPLSEAFWREVTGKPMQFLAFCLAYARWYDDPAQLVHLPLQIDGTCNGLQHIAALVGDAALARAVNVLPGDDDLPGDIYSELAKHAAGGLGTLPAAKFEAAHRRGLELAEQWLCASETRRGWLNRGTAKKAVMTIPYGASLGAQARHVLEVIAADFEREWPESPDWKALDALVEWKNESKERRVFVAKCSRGLFTRPPPQRANADTDEQLKRELKRADYERKRCFAAYVARVIVCHLRAALAEKYPPVDRFGAWLKKVANACQGLPLLWLSPLGFPVCQDKFRLVGTSATASLGAKEVRLDLQKLGDSVATTKQRDALLPNLIHSLDATHLAKTLLAAHDAEITDIGSIHDCLLCHPNDADDLARIVRGAFVELYRPQHTGVPEGRAPAVEGVRSEEGKATLARSLAQWCDWMDLLVQLKNLGPVNQVVGALEQPGGLGEMWLEGIAGDGEEEAKAALAVVQQVRALEPAPRFLVDRLLGYLQAHEIQSSKASTLPAPPAEGALPLRDADSVSEYFFS